MDYKYKCLLFTLLINSLFFSAPNEGKHGCQNILHITSHSPSSQRKAAAAAAAKSLQSCLTLCDPIVGSPPGSRQEYWSGLPFPSPMHENEKWKWSHSVVSNSQRPHGLQPSRLLHPWDFSDKSTGVGCHCLLRWRKANHLEKFYSLNRQLLGFWCFYTQI